MSGKVMKKIVVLILALLISSCTERLEVAILGDEAFTLIARDIDAGTTQRYVIEPGTPEYKNFSNWVKKNGEGWEQEKFKWFAPYEAFNDNFRILFSDKQAYITYNFGGNKGSLHKNINADLVQVFSEINTHNKQRQPDA